MAASSRKSVRYAWWGAVAELHDITGCFAS